MRSGPSWSPETKTFKHFQLSIEAFQDRTRCPQGTNPFLHQGLCNRLLVPCKTKPASQLPHHNPDILSILPPSQPKIKSGTSIENQALVPELLGTHLGLAPRSRSIRGALLLGWEVSISGLRLFGFFGDYARTSEGKD